MELDEKNLEKSLSDLGGEEKPQLNEQPQISKEEEIGFHKGALNTLVAERNELVKMIGNVEAIMQGHLKRLEELGVKLETKNN